MFHFLDPTVIVFQILLVNVDCSSEETVILGSSYQSEVLCAEPDNITDDAESALNSTNVSEYHDTVVDESEVSFSFSLLSVLYYYHYCHSSSVILYVCMCVLFSGIPIFVPDSTGEC